MAAYVDTRAQVTVISAVAAKRASIYHLIDGRYAGRATGVGHCKVLGRIPARHVYFMLGEGCDNDNNNDEYYEEAYGDYRGGHQAERRQHHNAFSEEESVHAIMDNLENELMGVDFIDDVDDDMDDDMDFDDLIADGEEDEIDMSGL